MERVLEPDKGISASLLRLLAVVAGLSVANLYYNQPLLDAIRADLAVSEFTVNLLPMTTQIGYALGLLFIIPLGDLFKRRRIVLAAFLSLAVALSVLGAARSIGTVLAASLVVGVCSVMPQIFIPIAAQFSRPEEKARNVGIVLSGLLTGILLSRVASGLAGEYWGWRTVYFIAAALMVLCAGVMHRRLPDMPANFSGTYGDLMRSLFDLVRHNGVLRMVSLRSGLCFGCFLALWACLAFRLSGAPFFAGPDTVGLLGLCGVAGAVTATFLGRFVPRFGVRRFNYAGCGILISAWLVLYLFQNGYAGLVAGILLMDIGMQCVQLSNQTCALSLAPGAANRVNTIFMTTYFLGGALGTLLAGTFWVHFQWAGVAGVGIALAGCSLLLTVFSRH